LQQYGNIPTAACKCGGINVKHVTQELPRETKALVELAKAQGWEHSKTSGGHHRLVSPDGKIVGMSGTPSDWRSVKNFRGQLKRAGLKAFVPVIVKEKQTVTVHQMKPETIAIMSQPVADLASVTKKKKQSSTRGHLHDVLIKLMTELDQPEGLGTDDLSKPLRAIFPDMPANGVSSCLSYWAKRGLLTKLRYARYRLTSLMPAQAVEPAPGAPIISAPATPPPAPTTSIMDVDVEDDIRKLDEALAALATIDSIVRKHREIVKQMAALKQLLGR
jgi:hypothetical protein